MSTTFTDLRTSSDRSLPGFIDLPTEGAASIVPASYCECERFSHECKRDSSGYWRCVKTENSPWNTCYAQYETNGDKGTRYVACDSRSMWPECGNCKKLPV